jgi:hypothetical protein
MFSRLFCKHEYELVARVNVFWDDDKTKTPLAHKLVYVCKKCLKIKIVKY